MTNPRNNDAAGMPDFEVLSTTRMTMNRPNRLSNMYMLAPFVWKDEEGFKLMVRATPRRPDDPRLMISEAWYGTSNDGFNFDMDTFPTLYPGPDMIDEDGCEDPTVVIADGQMKVWYTGYNAREKAGRLCYARGPNVRQLFKAGMAIGSRPPFYNAKEAELISMPGGGWRMHFEYARGDLSYIGAADADTLDGPWRDIREGPIKAREGEWDCGHLSPGPMFRQKDGTVLAFYNGGTPEANWRIGWVLLDEKLEKEIGRCAEPLIVPPVNDNPARSDIAFLASVVPHDGDWFFYYSLADMDLRCSVVRMR